MKKFFQKLKNDCRGAVTVFVTLLLIPAILISGTGVDLARVYTAKSLVHDANQLAANSMLAEYDALLQDLYGLFGVMAEDDELADMVDAYIRLSLGMSDDNIKSNSEGSFALFRGSELEPGTVTPAPGQNLDDVDVLRRQIEEYAKFRAPVIIVDEILDRIDSFTKVQEDSQVIKQKMAIDEGLEALDEIYREIYDKVKEVNKGKSTENSAIKDINARLGEIEAEIDRLWVTRNSYTDYFMWEMPEEADDMEAKYAGLVSNLNALAVGGTYYSGWINGNWNDDGEWEPGYWMDTSYKNGLSGIIGDYIQNLQKISTALDELKTLCESADTKKAELSSQVDALETRLNSGNCSKALTDGMTTPPKDSDKSIIEQYRDLLSYDISAMADAMLAVDKPQIQSFCEMIDNVIYEQASIDEKYTLSRLGSMNGNNDLSITIEIENRQRPANNQLLDRLALLDRMTPDKYSIGEPFELFQSDKFKSTKNPEFYKLLDDFYSGSSGDKKKAEALEKGLDQLLGDLKTMYKALLVYDPAGAHKLTGGSDKSTPNKYGAFADGDWGEDGSTSTLSNALDDSFFSGISSALNNAGNKILLLTYASEMFSCYSTPNSAEEGVDAQLTMSGVPMSTDVNYFFQSELEYLFHGNQTNAKENLQSVTGMILLVRFVFNYVASFTIPSVQKTVAEIKAAFSWTGPFAIAIGELARIAIALGESVMDVGRLKEGDMVCIIKSASTWRFSVEGLVNATTGNVKKLQTSDLDYKKEDDDPGVTLGYKDYLRIFLLFVDGDKMASRISDLIELNMTTKINGIGSDDHEAMEKAMAKVKRYDMSKAHTGFSLTTKVNLKMLFLSMPFAQNAIDGVVPPGTLPISATDYRGY